MSNRSRGALVGGVLALFVTAGTAAAFSGADDGGTTASTPGGTSISVRSTTTTATSASSSTTSTSTSSPSSSEVIAGVSAAEAERKALAEVGGGRVERTEREFEHGRWEWRVRIDCDGERRDVRVDAETATVRPDDGSGHRGRGGDHRGRGGDGR